MARLELVRTLRELGLGLDVVRAVLSQAATLTQVAAAHVAVLDEQIRILRLRRAVLAAVATRGNTIEETRLMHQLARLSAQQRQQLIDDFVAGVFAGIDPEAPGAAIARGMRQLPAELPDDPSPAQVDAWIELGELIADESFRSRVRTMALAGQQAGPQAGPRTGQPESTGIRVERYWQLLAVLNDRPAFPATAPAFEWLIAALRAAQPA